MNKFIIFLIVVAVAVAGWFAFGLSNDYEVVVVDEVSQLETELAALDMAVSNGTLTSAQAVEARTKIANRLASITANASGTSDVNLTSAQRAQLQSGLQRLKDVLIKYQATLVAVDTTAAKDTRRSGSGGKSLASQFIDAVDSFEEVVSDVVDGYETDESTDDVIEQIDSETFDTIDEIVSDIQEDEQATSTTEVDVEGEVILEDDSDETMSSDESTEDSSENATVDEDAELQVQ